MKNRKSRGSRKKDVYKRQPVSSADAKPGDLIFFQGTYNTSGASHVGIYVGNCLLYTSSELAAKDSALFLWATFPQLNEAFRVIDAWGFKYKTLAFLWLKQNRKADS